ncbi:MAG: DNA primase [Wenzhouxiangella sp.]
MAGRIPEDFIESLLERVDIVDVVGSRVALKAAGRGEHKGLCPFHDEKTPSFTVSSAKQFYHCFGCGAHGTAIGFLMAHDGLEFPGAVEELAHIAGLEVPREAGQPAAERHDQVYAALASAQQWFRQQLGASPMARDYLKSRGFDKATVDEFGIGFAPDQWQGLIDALGRDGFGLTELEKAGLISRGEQRSVDKFRNRVMFPIHDRRGRVIAFGGRALGDQGPKYMNSPETAVFHKGRELYRLYQVRRRGLPQRILVVEGYMDAAALHQFGFEDVVATLGTAVTRDHLELLFKATPVVVFCFDGDRAGRQAAWRGLETALPMLKANREIRFFFLPDGEDPDSLVRTQGRERFTALLDQARPLSQVFFDELSAQVDMNTLDGRARLVALAEPYLARLPDGPFAELLKIELERLSGHQGPTRTVARPASRRALTEPGEDRPLTPIQYAVALLVQNPGLAHRDDIFLLDIPADIKGLNFLRELVDICAQKPHFSTAKLLELWRERPEAPWLARLAVRAVCSEDEQMPTALAQTMARIRHQQVQARVRELQEAQLVEGGLDAGRMAELRELLSLRAETHQD